MEREIFLKRLKNIKSQEKEFPVKINFSENDVVSLDRLDCFWYTGKVGTIEYNGYTVLIMAEGEVDCFGKVDGSVIEYKSRKNYGPYETGDFWNINDSRLLELEDSIDSNNYISFDNNNWFEFNIVSPTGEFFDCSNYDNILDQNILNAFEGVEFYIEVIEDIISKNASFEESNKAS